MGRHPEYLESDPTLPGRAGSYWLASVPETPSRPPVSASLDTDVVVIGSGLAGVLTAHELVRQGVDVVLVEARTALADVTGHTTAKLTTVHGKVIADIAKRAGADDARAHVAANHAAVQRIESLAHTLGIECELRRVDTVAYVEDPTTSEAVDELFAVLDSAGVGPAGLTQETWGLPYDMASGLLVEREIRFHPVKFGVGVLAEFERLGGRLFENSRVTKIDETGTGVSVSAGDAEVRAKAAIVCTNYPFHDHGSLFSRLYPYRSYVLAAYLRDEVPDRMYVSLDDSPNLRLQDTDDGPLVIASGFSHKAGVVDDEREYYRQLETSLRDRFTVDRIAWHWSTQDNRTPDGLPFIGRSPGMDHVYVVSGFSAWGMSQAAVAAWMLPSIVAGEGHELEDLYTPLRFEAGSSGEFLKESASVVKEFATTLFAEEGAIEDLAPGEGRRFRKGASRVGVYRDYDGRLHQVSARCTHLGCGLEFNAAEKTWDCPCHGSRFAVDGTVLHGPAVRDLEAE